MSGNYSGTFTAAANLLEIRFQMPALLAGESTGYFYLDDIYLEEVVAYDGGGVGEDGYRYSFQGQEHDDEVKGPGNEINYRFRMQDPRLGRFLSVDPLFGKYPMLSPYHFSHNSPIATKEIEGLEGDTKFLLWEAQRVAPKIGITTSKYINQIRPFGKIPDEALMPLVETVAGFIPYVSQGIDAKDTYQAYSRGDAWDKVFATVAWIPGFDLFKGIRKLFKTEKFVANGIKGINNVANKIDNLLEEVESLRLSFEKGKYSIATTSEDITVFRISGGNSKRGTGAFFSTVKPQNSAEPEKLLNINKWGNTGVEVTPVTIKKGSVFAIGKVEGGKGTQIYIPKDLRKTEGNNIIRHYSQTEKLE